MRSLLKLSAAALMGLGFIAAAPAQSQAQVVSVGWAPQPVYYGYAPPPAYYAPPPPRYYAPPVYYAPPPPPVFFAPRPRFYGPGPWAYRHHGGYRRW